MLAYIDRAGQYPVVIDAFRPVLKGEPRYTPKRVHPSNCRSGSDAYANMVRGAKSPQNDGVRPAVPTLALLAGLAGCWTQTIGGPGPAVSTGTGGGGGARQRFHVLPTRNQLDLLLVVDDSANAVAQQKLVAQLPALVQALAALPDGLPDLHIGVISTDMGTGAQQTAGCTARGKAGELQSAPRGNCADSTLTPGATFISAAGGLRNFTAPLEQVLQCLTPLGTGGCGFTQPLAAVLRALGADGSRPPAANQGFLRPAAALGVLILSTRDDCSPTPSNTDLFSVDSGSPGLSDPLGPLNTYRCNRYGHLCQPGGTMLAAMPPLLPPTAAVPVGPAAVELANCTPNDMPGGRLTTVPDVVAMLGALKDDANDKILVAAITGPAAPYGVQWSPAGAANPQNPNELWPAVMLSCGAPGDPSLNPATMDRSSDGTEGEPALRLGDFSHAFPHGLSSSICDPSYASAMTAIAQGLGTVARGSTCVGSDVRLTALKQPDCTVVASYVDPSNALVHVPIPSCATGVQTPCWGASNDRAVCPNGGYAITIIPDPSFQNAAGLAYDFSCAL